jgi:putative SOS response-associated peptidase YedK
MCGRYSQTKDAETVARRFNAAGDAGPARFNIAPTQNAPVIGFAKSGPRLTSLRWGLVPSGAKDPSVGVRLINARAETLSKKPSFREAFRKRRCLVPADGFYEWRDGGGGKKSPVRVVRKDRGLFAMAGLWERWRRPDGSDLVTFCIVTVAANDLMRPVHERMPLILPPERETDWLNPALTDPQRLLEPLSCEELEIYPVSSAVNSARNESPECAEAVAA